jgi:group I intron endonuclease
MSYSVYIHQNKKNRKIYVGYSKDVEYRWWQTEYNAKRVKFAEYNDPFYNAIRRDGWDAFTHTVIETFDNKQDTLDAEVFWIAFFRSNRRRYGTEYGYNLTDGGDSAPHQVGAKRSLETCKNISNALQKHYAEHESKRKGIPLTEEHKANVSKGSMGKPGTNTGKTFSPEWRLKISKSSIGHKSNNKRFSIEKESEICNMYVKDKKSMHFIAKKFMCAKTTVSNILVSNKIEKREASNYIAPSLFSIEKQLEICNKYKTGKFSFAGLAEHFQCSSDTIKKILVKYNIL